MHTLITRLNTGDTRSHRLVFFVIFMLAIGLRILCFEGYADANPRAYAMLAHDLSTGELHIPDETITPVFPVRIGAYAPAAGLIGLFGLSEITMVGFVFLVDLLSLVLIYVVCRTTFGGCAGLIGLLLLSISPLDVTMGSRFLPHLVAAFWANLGMCLVWAVIAMELPSKRRWLGAGLAGLCFGLSGPTSRTDSSFFRPRKNPQAARSDHVADRTGVDVRACRGDELPLVANGRSFLSPARDRKQL